MARRRVVRPNRNMPDVVRPVDQLAPLYGGRAGMDAAIQQAQAMSQGIYPTMQGIDPQLAAQFPPIDYSRYGQEIPLDVADLQRNAAGFYNPSYGDPDMPMGDNIVVPQGDTIPTLSQMIDTDTLEMADLERQMLPETIPGNIERPITDFLTMPTGEGADLAARRTPLAPGSEFEEFTTPEQIDQTLAQMRRRYGDAVFGQFPNVDPSYEDAAALLDFGMNEGARADVSFDENANTSVGLGPIGDNPLTRPDTGISVAQLLALRDLPQRVKNFLPARMGMIPSLMGGAVGLGMAAGAGRQQQPSMRTDYTMGPLSGLMQ